MTYGIQRRISFRVLDRDDLDKIHWGTLHVLEKVGVQVNSKSCRDLLSDSGCEVDEKSRTAPIPSHLVQETLKKRNAQRRSQAGIPSTTRGWISSTAI